MPLKILIDFTLFVCLFATNHRFSAQKSACWPLRAQTRAETGFYGPMDLDRYAGLNPKASQNNFRPCSFFFDFSSFGPISAISVKMTKMASKLKNFYLRAQHHIQPPWIFKFDPYAHQKIVFTFIWLPWKKLYDGNFFVFSKKSPSGLPKWPSGSTFWSKSSKWPFFGIF